MFENSAVIEDIKAGRYFRDSLRNFLDENVRKIEFRPNIFPEERFEKIARAGLLGIPFSKEVGGVGGSIADEVILIEEITRFDGDLGNIVGTQMGMVASAIASYGTDEQKEKYLIPLMKGEKVGAFAIKENADSETTNPKLINASARYTGSHFLILGHKDNITNAPRADIYIVFAKTYRNNFNSGISAFIVEKNDIDMHFEAGKGYNDGNIIFENVVVPKENMLGEEGKGIRIAEEIFNRNHILIAAQSLGVAKRTYEITKQYYDNMRQHSALAPSKGTRMGELINEIKAKIYTARTVIYASAKIPENWEDYLMEVSIARQTATEVALEIANLAVKFFDIAGDVSAIDVNRMYKDVMIAKSKNEFDIIRRLASEELNSGYEDIMASESYTPYTGSRKKIMITAPTEAEKAHKLFRFLKKDGYDFSIGYPVYAPASNASRLIVAGRGIGPIENIEKIEKLAEAVGATFAGTRPVVEDLKYSMHNRYIGLAGSKFFGNLYIGCGVSGAPQHLRGIRNASTIVAINNDPSAPIFQNCDYGIVSDFNDIIPYLIEAFSTEEKKLDIEYTKIHKAILAKKSEKLYNCPGCGYKYNPTYGDPIIDVKPGTGFEDLPSEWKCPLCNEVKDRFILEQ